MTALQACSTFALRWHHMNCLCLTRGHDEACAELVLSFLNLVRRLLIFHSPLFPRVGVEEVELDDILSQFWLLCL